MSSLILLFMLGIALWFWVDSLRAREQASTACEQACRRYQVQLLDDTVALESLWPRRRRSDGRLVLERRYVFEFTDTGATRRCGSIMMLGRHVEVIHMEPHDLLVP